MMALIHLHRVTSSEARLHGLLVRSGNYMGKLSLNNSSTRPTTRTKLQYLRFADFCDSFTVLVNTVSTFL